MAVFSLSVGVRAVDRTGSHRNVHERICKCILATKRWGGGGRGGGESRVESNGTDESHFVDGFGEGLLGTLMLDSSAFEVKNRAIMCRMVQPRLTARS